MKDLKYFKTYEEFSIKNMVKIAVVSAIPFITASCTKNGNLTVQPVKQDSTSVIRQTNDTPGTRSNTPKDKKLYWIRFIAHSDIAEYWNFYHNGELQMERDPIFTKNFSGSIQLYQGDSIRFAHHDDNRPFSVTLNVEFADSATSGQLIYSETKNSTTEDISFVIQ